ncbi:hypothetical protein [Arthrobacter cheniae]|uniref:hypothetical protein n=1 Tax=Arthrobacter cheniae TaxID=1258888 RepID=UPI0016033CA3|nr:hypothetical protein [Arthrobacter cheniae]
MVTPDKISSESLPDTPLMAEAEVFSAESEARICRMVMGLKAHGIDQLIRPL